MNEPRILKARMLEPQVGLNLKETNLVHSKCLKVHKREKFFVSDFEFFIIL